MRKYILSDLERRTIIAYLHSGKKVGLSFRMVKSRLLNLDTTDIKKDLALIKQFKEATK